jgi:hypothetical protein
MDRNELVESLIVLKYCLSSDDFCSSYWDEDGVTTDNMMNTYNDNLNKIICHYNENKVNDTGRHSTMAFVDKTLQELGWEWYDDWQDDALRAF